MAEHVDQEGSNTSLDDTPSGNGIPTHTTIPDHLLRHNISDDELQTLSDMRRSYLQDGKWVALGTCLGALTPAYTSLNKAYIVEEKLTTPLSAGDLMQVLVFFGALLIFITLIIVMGGKEKDAGDLVAEIRARDKREDK